MNLIGNHLTRVDDQDQEGLSYFKSLYNMDPYRMIFEHQIFHITRLLPRNIQNVVFIENDGDINQVMSLNEDEHLVVYSDGCMAEEGRVFNTDGMAFIELIRNGKQVAMWAVDNSPYDLTIEDWEEDMYDEISLEEELNNLNELLKKFNTNKVATETNTLFVRQL